MKRAKWLRQVEILSSLSERQLALLAGVLHAVTFETNERIIRQGDVGDTFYIVEEGHVTCRMDDRNEPTEIASFGPGDYFGEMALLSDMPRNASVYAKGPVKCLMLGRQEFDTMLGPLTNVLDRNSRIRMLRMFAPFMNQKAESLDPIIQQLEIKDYYDGQYVYKEDETATMVYIVKTGCIKLTKCRVDTVTGDRMTEEIVLKANDTFGEEAFDSAGIYNSTAVSCGQSQCHQLNSSCINTTLAQPAKSCTLRLEDLTMVLSLSTGWYCLD